MFESVLKVCRMSHLPKGQFGPDPCADLPRMSLLYGKIIYECPLGPLKLTERKWSKYFLTQFFWGDNLANCLFLLGCTTQSHCS